MTTQFLQNESNPQRLWDLGVHQNLSDVLDVTPACRFHVGMLSIGLLVGLVYGGYVCYKCWLEGEFFSSYVRNLVLAMVWKTFIALVSQSTFALGDSADESGFKVLRFLEVMALNVAMGLWLFLTIYLRARLRKNFSNEPELSVIQYVIAGVGVYYALVWTFVDQSGKKFHFYPTCWITASIRLLFLILQLAYVMEVAVRIILKKSSYDNDSIALLRNIFIAMGAQTFILWLHFGISVSTRPLKPDAHLYFYFFLDGLLCAFYSPILYFLDKWVPLAASKTSLTSTNEARRTTEVSVDELSPRGIVTVNSLLATTRNAEGSKDVVYSNVVPPERLKKTFDLYKRMEAWPKNNESVVEGEEFYECIDSQTIVSGASFKDANEDPPNGKVLNNMVFDNVQKKNAFYSSKYLIVENRDKGFPRYLETRPSISSADEETVPRKTATKEIHRNAVEFPSASLVQNWLKECSEEKNRKSKETVEEKSRKSENEENPKNLSKESANNENGTKDFESVAIPAVQSLPKIDDGAGRNGKQGEPENEKSTKENRVEGVTQKN